MIPHDEVAEALSWDRQKSELCKQFGWQKSEVNASVREMIERRRLQDAEIERLTAELIRRGIAP